MDQVDTTAREHRLGDDEKFGKGTKRGVAVCIITYRRPEGLRRLLAALDGLRFDKSELPDIQIVVVDNDPAGSALDVCEDMGATLKWPLEYHAEPRRGIAHARNAALACAGKDQDFVAFIDDDEVPQPHWLDALLDVQGSYDADVVSGPVFSYFCDQVPPWVIRGKFFEQAFANPRYETGHPIELTATGNVLIRTRILREMNIKFDERLGLTGGEDIHFFRRVHRAGYRMVYAGEAVVHEWIPKSRTNARWMLKRAYRLGNALTLSETYLEPTRKVQLVRIIKGGVRVAQGLFLLPVSVALSLVFGQHLIMKSLLYVCRGFGMLAGLAGVRFEPYR